MSWKPINANPFAINPQRAARELQNLPDAQIYQLLKQASVHCACTWCGLAKEELAKRNIKQAS